MRPRSAQTRPSNHARHAFYSTTHEAARIPELLLRYFRHLTGPEVVNSAIVCRSWSTLALDTLWRHHEVPLSVLLGQLPFLYEKPFDGSEDEAEFMFEVEANSGLIHSSWHPLKEQSSPESIDVSAWNLVLDKYARRIARLFLDTTLLGSSIHLLDTLLNGSGSLVLCPSLKSLRFSMGPYVNLETLHSRAIPVLCGSSVTNIELDSLAESEEDPFNVNPINVAEQLGVALKTCGSQIQRFVLRSPYPNTFTPDFTLFTHLTEVHLDNLSLCGWRKLADNCPHLLKVYLKEGGTHRPDFTRDPTKSIDFLSLRKLSIDRAYLAYSVLVESNMPALESLAMNGLVRDDNGVMSMQLTERSSLLQEVELGIFNYSGGFGSIRTALSSLCRLRKLKLDGILTKWDMADGDMDVLARSVPRLQSISITFVQAFGLTIPLTHATILSLVQHCRQLTEIELPMDLSRADDSEEKPVGFTPSTTVTTLKF
ncbi:hypothetical protein FRB95_004308 [Tulasnella sp. JGI-2019a]|nr:hypothetical protein FRB95_004308 [Tulasnella sp. JGI-2019a]